MWWPLTAPTQAQYPRGTPYSCRCCFVRPRITEPRYPKDACVLFGTLCICRRRHNVGCSCSCSRLRNDGKEQRHDPGTTFLAMTTYIGLLRAVHLAGHNKVAMGDLRELLAGLGMQDARSLIQSGNLVFRSDGRTAKQLERVLEDAAAKHLGLKTDFFIRTANEWKVIIAGNPLPAEAQSDPSHLLVLFMKQAPDRDDVAALQRAITGREVVRVKGRHAYVFYPDGIGRSRLTSALFEKKLGTRGTGRNWNTVLKLAALAEVS